MEFFKKHKKRIMIILAMVVFWFFYLNLLGLGSNDPSYHTFVIVRHHDVGDAPSNDRYRAYAFGWSFRIYGATSSNRLQGVYARSPVEAKAQLKAVIGDTTTETQIIEIVKAKDL